MNEPHPVSAIERTLRQRLLGAYRRSFDAPPFRLLVGFSGGNDSLALAVLLDGIRPLLNIEIILIHVDHRMRPESGVDADAARALAERIGLPIKILRSADTPQVLFPGVGPEEAARRVRYELFASEANTGDAVVLAHHAGDQAETVLLHLIRGSGTNGLAGMSESSSITVPWWDRDSGRKSLSVWRPLLSESKSDLSQLVSTIGHSPIEDPSNDDLVYRRNEIRHKLVPLLKEIEPTIEERLGNLARIARDEAELLATFTGIIEDSCQSGTQMSRAVLNHAHPAIARRMLRAWLTDRFGFEASFDRIEAVRRLSERNNGGAVVQIGEHLVAWIDKTHVHVSREERDAEREH